MVAARNAHPHAALAHRADGPMLSPAYWRTVCGLAKRRDRYCPDALSQTSHESRLQRWADPESPSRSFLESASGRAPATTEGAPRGCSLAPGLVRRRRATALTLWLKPLFFGVSVGDPAAYGGAALVLLMSAVAACALPALIAAKASPAQSLRT